MRQPALRLLLAAGLAIATAGCWRPLVVLHETSEVAEALVRGAPEAGYLKRRPSPFHALPGGVKVIAHRGFPKVAPENTLPSFRAAIAAGADAVEFDVRLTRDGVPVVIHDGTVDRTTDGAGRVDHLTYLQLRALDAGIKKGPAFKGTRVPTLDETLAVIRGRALAVLELKSPDLRLPRIVARALDRHRMADRTLVISFHPASLLRHRTLRPDQPVGLLAYPYDPPHRRALAARADAALGFFGALDRRAIRTAHQAGLEVFTWTVNDRETMERMVALGVDGLITDDTTLAREVVAMAAAAGRRKPAR